MTYTSLFDRLSFLNKNEEAPVSQRVHQSVHQKARHEEPRPFQASHTISLTPAGIYDSPPNKLSSTMKEALGQNFQANLEAQETFRQVAKASPQEEFVFYASPEGHLPEKSPIRSNIPITNKREQNQSKRLVKAHSQFNNFVQKIHQQEQLKQSTLEVNHFQALQ
mmetsp:Transcript_10444/g.10496  ORF Transcript_10444/g.10496 Transcript_10444/m.10496 type:complete len:165 (-) Transcript_10444:351-845(-)